MGERRVKSSSGFQSRGSLNPGTPLPRSEREEPLVSPSQGAEPISEPLIFGKLSHFALSKAYTLPNNTYSKLFTVLMCSCFSMYLWLLLCLI